jgi:hypothetical protein
MGRGSRRGGKGGIHIGDTKELFCIDPPIEALADEHLPRDDRNQGRRQWQRQGVGAERSVAGMNPKAAPPTTSTIG